MELYYYTGPEDEQGEQLIPDNGFPSILYQIEGQDVVEADDGEKWKVNETIGYTFWTTDYEQQVSFTLEDEAYNDCFKGDKEDYKKLLELEKLKKRKREERDAKKNQTLKSSIDTQFDDFEASDTIFFPGAGIDQPEPMKQLATLTKEKLYKTINIEMNKGVFKDLGAEDWAAEYKASKFTEAVGKKITDNFLSLLSFDDVMWKEAQSPDEGYNTDFSELDEVDSKRRRSSSSGHTFKEHDIIVLDKTKVLLAVDWLIVFLSLSFAN